MKDYTNILEGFLTQNKENYVNFKFTLFPVLFGMETFEAPHEVRGVNGNYRLFIFFIMIFCTLTLAYRQPRYLLLGLFIT